MISYRRFKFEKLDGKETYISNTKEIESLVTEFYHGNIPSSYSGTKSYRIACPRCVQRNKDNITHKNLSISSDFTIGHCFRCELTIVDEIKGANKEINFERESFKLKAFEIERIKCDSMEKALDIQNDDNSINYIKERNPYYDINRNQFHLKCKPNKIIIPYFDKNTNWIYYQFRYIDESKSPTDSKYYNPVIDMKPLFLTCEENGKVDWKVEHPTILVEGALTAIALKLVVQGKANVVGLMGKTLTDYQVQFLKRLYFSKLFIMMDELSLSEQVSKKLLDNYSIESIIIDSDGRDAEEMISDTKGIGFEKYKTYIDMNLFPNNYKQEIVNKNNSISFSIPNTNINKPVHNDNISFNIKKNLWRLIK